MSLISTLPQRAREVSPQDFGAGISLELNRNTLQTKDRVLAIWNKHVPYLPQDISRIFDPAKKHGLSLSVEGRCDDELRFVLRHEDDSDYTMQQLYNFSRRTIEGSDVSLKKEKHGGGTGTALNNMYLDLCIALGMQEIRFEARLKCGGYVWAKQGYYLDRTTPERKFNAQLLSQIILSKLGVLEPVIPALVLNKAILHARFCNDDDIHHLARMDYDLQPFMDRGGMDYIKLALPASVEKHVHQIQYDELSFGYITRNLKSLDQFSREKGVPLTLGKYALMGEAWNGYANFQNDRQMSKIIEYGGGLRFSEIVQSNIARGHSTRPAAFQIA